MFDLLQYTFFRNALLAVVILSIASSLIGTYIITRRMVAISGGLTHACFGGLGLGYYLGINPIITAALFAIGSSAGIEWLAQKHRVREDSAIAVTWSVGMALGVIFVFLTPGYVPELNAFLFGNILTVTTTDLLLFATFTLLLLLFFITNYRRIVICAFDRDFAKVSGIPANFINYTMTVLVAICIVLTIRLVGIMLLMSLFSLPQMTAEVFCNKFKSLIWSSMAISLTTCMAGLMLSTLSDVPCSAIIVILMTTAFAVARIIATLLKTRYNKLLN